MGFVNEETEDGVWQTIDRDRGVALIYKGRPGGDAPYQFYFTYKEKKVPLDAGRLMKKNSQGKDDITWNIESIFIPEEIKQDKKEIIGLIEEAFDVCGFLFSRKYVNTVSVNFDNLDI